MYMPVSTSESVWEVSIYSIFMYIHRCANRSIKEVAKQEREVGQIFIDEIERGWFLDGDERVMFLISIINRC